MFDQTFLEVISKEGVVAIVSSDEEGPHVVNTWNSYLVTKDDDKLLIPAAGMRKTQKKVDKNASVLMTVGSKEVMGRRSMGTGFLIKGTARFSSSGSEFDMMKEKFSFLTRVLEVTVKEMHQTL